MKIAEETVAATREDVRPADNGLLAFSDRNAKTGPGVFMFNLLSGITCPGARDCHSWVNQNTGKIQDGPHCKFRCFSASQEIAPNVLLARLRNLNLLRQASTVSGMAKLVEDSIATIAATIIRIHTAGDFFSQDYFDAWLAVAVRRPEVLFYAYTKSLPFWVARLGSIPSNLVLTASYGGKYDHLIAQYNLRFARVVFSPEEAAELGLEIDHDDSHAMVAGPSFGLLLHGNQRPKTAAAAALADLRRRKIKFSYGRPAAGSVNSHPSVDNPQIGVKEAA